MVSFRSDNLRRLGRSGVKISLPTDGDGYFGRKCPQTTCEGVFKIKPGTGLTGQDLPCYCAYCGHSAPHDQFFTQEQVKYVQSVAMRQVSDALIKDLKGLEFEIKPPRRGLGIGLSMKVTPGRRIPLHRIREPELETRVTCSGCTLDYAVYGLFAYCPDCGTHNSLHILVRNLSLTLRQLDLSRAQDDQDLATHLVEDALENCVSAFDGFGREIVRVYASKSSKPAACPSLSFQNLARASDSLIKLFGVDLRATVSAAVWDELNLGFMRRHLLAHRFGVIDQKYIDDTGEPLDLLGKRISIETSDVERLAKLVETLGGELDELISSLP